MGHRINSTYPRKILWVGLSLLENCMMGEYFLFSIERGSYLFIYFAWGGMLCFFAAVLWKQIMTHAPVLQLQSRGPGLHVRSCFAERVVQEHMRHCRLRLQGHCQRRPSAPWQGALFPFQTAPPCLFPVWFVQGVTRTPRSGVQPIFFSLSFSLRLKIPVSHLLSVDTDAPKSRVLVHTFRCLAGSPVNTTNTTVADSIWWPFVLTFQPFTN